MSNEDGHLAEEVAPAEGRSGKVRNWVEPGVLYVVATPIGNLADFSSRAVDVLRSVDVIACEDTRHARKLLDHFGIATPVISAHEHNEAARSVQIADRLTQGQAVALISDAGTPAISDPGALLVRAVRAAGLPVSPIPGAAAVTTALSASGLDTRHFWFEGFLPSRAAARRDRLIELRKLPATLVFYEAPHRIVSMMNDLVAVLGTTRQGVLAREVSKRFEQFRSAPLAELARAFEEGAVPAKGEFVVMVAADDRPDDADQAGIEADLLIDALMTEGVSAKTIARVVGRLTPRSRNAVYQEILSRKQVGEAGE